MSESSEQDTQERLLEELPDVTFASSAESPLRSRSIRENTPLLARPDYEIDVVNFFPEDSDYSHIVHESEDAIDHGILPQRIYQGSSGSYFVKNREGVSCQVYTVYTVSFFRH